jgi:hypothetical protein
MNLKDFVLSEENIYWAIYSAKSYVFDFQLLSFEDKELLNSLSDPFNEVQIKETIEKVKKILKEILEEENNFFEVQVYFKPKDYDKGKLEFRPIHTSSLENLIAMVAMLHPLVYEVPNKTNGLEINLSNYSRLIPENFYGNRVTKEPEYLFKKWNQQYKKYTEKSNEYFKTYYESREYKYEVKLDLEKFFPSVNPLMLYGIFMENFPVVITDANSEEDVQVLKNVIYKLLICKITNLTTNLAKKEYYFAGEVENTNKYVKEQNEDTYAKGIPQGLPQSYFFGNICMIKIAEIFNKEFPGKSVYYVDDSYIYTNENIVDKEKFQLKLQSINNSIKEITNKYIEIALKDIENNDATKNKLIEWKENKGHKEKNIKVHLKQKSTFSVIQDYDKGEIYLKNLI